MGLVKIPLVYPYSAVAHYLKAVKEAGADATQVVLAKMKELPVNDFMTDGAEVRADGRLMRDMYLFEVKSPAESSGEWDYFKVLSVVPGSHAFLPADQSPCALLKG